MNDSNVKMSLQSGYVLVERPSGYEIVMETHVAEGQRLADFCKEVGCKKVLITGKDTKVDLEGLDLYDLGKELAQHHLQIAVVEIHDASEENVFFFQNVSTNRGGPINFFNTEEKAKEWLGVS